MSGTRDGTRDIENEIERTRNDLTDILQAIERKLSPNRLMDEAMQSMRNVNISGTRVAELMRDNPVPLALLGVGLSWLVLSSLRGGSVLAGEASDEEFGEGGYQGVAGGGMGEAAEWAGYGAGGGGNGSRRLGEMSGEARGRAGEASREVREGARGLGLQAQEQVRHVGQRVGQLTSSVRRSAGEWAGRGSDLFQEHPLTVGLMAAMAGLALGASLPRAWHRAEVSGEGGGELLPSRGGGRQALHKAGRVVQRAAEAMVEGGGGTLQRTKEAVKDEAKRQNLKGGEGDAVTAH